MTEKAKKWIDKMIHDPSINEDWWETKGQHIRDDIQRQLKRGYFDLEELKEFHGSVVTDLWNKYFDN